jgi:hypothetical protein
MLTNFIDICSQLSNMIFSPKVLILVLVSAGAGSVSANGTNEYHTNSSLPTGDGDMNNSTKVQGHGAFRGRMLASCGGGSRGDGVCADGTCCSQWGWCGTSADHCGTSGGSGGTFKSTGRHSFVMLISKWNLKPNSLFLLFLLKVAPAVAAPVETESVLMEPAVPSGAGAVLLPIIVVVVVVAVVVVVVVRTRALESG